MKREIKRVSRLINEKGYIPIMQDNIIILVVNKRTGEEYMPKYELAII